MGSRGLWKLHHAAQTMEAKRDFARLANDAINAGRVDLVKKHFYREGAGWRTIDRCIAKLRKALARLFNTTPTNIRFIVNRVTWKYLDREERSYVQHDQQRFR